MPPLFQLRAIPFGPLGCVETRASGVMPDKLQRLADPARNPSEHEVWP
jgi:hypothetical protein